MRPSAARPHGDHLGACEANLFKDAPEVKQTKQSTPYLLRAYPNPFSQSTTLEFQLPENTRAALKIFNLTGSEVVSVFEGMVEKDKTYRFEVESRTLSAGIYFYKLSTAGMIYSGKLVVVE